MQLEFYFSDSNLPKDKFLKGKVAEDPEGCESCRSCVPAAGEGGMAAPPVHATVLLLTVPCCCSSRETSNKTPSAAS